MRFRSVSLRWQIGIAVSLMALLLLGVALISVIGMQKAAYLLLRADNSHRQLELTSRLSSAINAHAIQRIDAALQGAKTTGLEASQRQIEVLLRDLQQAFGNEVDMLRDPAERISEGGESARIAELRGAITRAFDTPSSEPPYGWVAGAGITFEDFGSRLLGRIDTEVGPVIARVVADEQAEIDRVETEMAHLRAHLTWGGIGIGIVTVLLAIALLVYANRAISRPITALIGGVTALSGGDLRRRLSVFGRNELGLLARHFNRMASHLEHQRTKLETLNRELELRVAERTDQLRQSHDRLQLIDESRKRFLANVSHELRTPLTAILGETELNLRECEDKNSELAQSLLRINANAGYLRRRVQDLLLLARSEEGVLQLASEKTDLAQLVRDVSDQVRGLADVEQVAILDRVGNEAAWVNADRSWLGQCLMGLIDNAVKFSTPGDRVEITLDGDSRHWRVTINDQGPGFDDAAVPRLFDRYYQTQGGRMRGGAGLGLAIAHWIVHQHDGRIAIANTPVGASVTIELKKAGVDG